jgi:hypothetical protein
VKRTLLFAVSLGFLWVWLIVWDYFYESIPEGLWFRHRHGVRAVAEEFVAALYAPAYFVSRVYKNFQSRSDHLPILVLSILQLWPLFLLVFRPWASLSRITHRVIIGYVAACAAAIVAGFTYFHYINQIPIGP